MGQPFAELMAIPIRALASLDRNVRSAWNQYLALRGVYDQNQELRKQIEVLQGEMNQLREKAMASDRLAALLAFREGSQLQLVAARVIGRNATNWYRALILDKGKIDGIRVKMGVVTPAGVVGSVVKVRSSTCIVLLLTDPNLAVPGLVQRTRG